MSGKFARSIKGQRDDLARKIPTDLPFLNKLVDKEIINEDQAESVRSKTERYERGDTLIRVMERLDDNKFDAFCEILAGLGHRDVVKNMRDKVYPVVHALGSSAAEASVPVHQPQYQLTSVDGNEITRGLAL